MYTRLKEKLYLSGITILAIFLGTLILINYMYVLGFSVVLFGVLFFLHIPKQAEVNEALKREAVSSTKLEVFLLYIFLFSIAILPFRFQRIRIGDLSIPAAAMFLTFLTYVVFLSSCLRNRMLIYQGYLITALLFFLSMILPSVISAKAFQGNYIVEYTIYLFIPFILCGTVTTLKKVENSFFILIFCGICLGLISCFYLKYTAFSFLIIPSSLVVATKNALSLHFETAFILILAFFLFRQYSDTFLSPSNVFALIIIIALLALNAFLVFGVVSRGSWISTSVGTVFLLTKVLKECRRPKTFLKLAITVTVLLSVFYYGWKVMNPDRLLSRMESIRNLTKGYIEGDINRKLQAQAALKMVQHSPIGIGKGNFEKEIKKRGLFFLESNHPHNSYLYLVAEQGFLGLGAFIVLLFIPVFNIIKYGVDCNPLWLKYGALGVLFSFYRILWGKMLLYPTCSGEE